MAAKLKLTGLILLGALVGTIHVAAFFTPSRFVPVPDAMRLPLSALGLLFLGCGMWAWLVRPSRVTRAFLIYCAGMSIHWGGTLGASSQAVATTLLVVYAAATAAGDGALLDLALRFPNDGARPARAASAVYSVALATVLAAPVAPFAPQTAIAAGLGLVLMASFLISIAAAVVFIAKWFRATANDRRELGLSAIVAAFLTAGVANLLGEGGALPGPPQAWALSYALVPSTLAWVLTRAEPVKMPS